METSQPGFTTHIIAMQVDQPIKQNRVLFWACTNLGTLQGKKNDYESSKHVNIYVDQSFDQSYWDRMILYFCSFSFLKVQLSKG